MAVTLYAVAPQRWSYDVSRDYIGWKSKCPGLDPAGARPERNVGGPPFSVKVAPHGLRMRHQSHQKSSPETSPKGGQNHCGSDYIGGPKATGSNPVGARWNWKVVGPLSSVKVAPRLIQRWPGMRDQSHQSHQDNKVTKATTEVTAESVM